jgi:glycosyltransferase involved in cell wall biosynthesis
MGVLEALSYGVPCLLTTGTNYAEEVRVAGAGAAVAPTPTSIASGFEALAISRSKLEEMSEAARSLSKQNTWVKVAEDTLSAYQRLLEE